jgi:hypothetical protein
MKQFIKALDDMPFIVKILLCLPVLDIVWNIYRICKSADKNNNTGIILGVIVLLLGSCTVVWLVDLISVILKKEVLWID